MHRRGSGRRLRTGTAAALILAGCGVAAAALWVVLWDPAAPPAARGRPTALFVGDSYISSTPDNFACQTARRLGWSCVVDAIGGTGYAGARAYPGRLADDVARYRPDWVVVTGGRNDSQDEDAPAAADRYLTDVRDAFPDAGLVVVGPFWDDSRPPASVLRLRDQLRTTAGRLGARFVDPLEDRWITEENAGRYIGADGVHPNAAGHRYLAERLAAALDR